MSTRIHRRDGGYATFPNRWVDAGYMAKAPGSVTQVFLFLCRWSDNTTLAAAQPMRLIADKCGLSEDIARRAVRTLEAWGVIHRESESGPNACNVWTLNELPAMAPDYPDKVPPKLSGPPESGPPESGGPYQPNVNQPDDDQPESRLTRPQKTRATRLDESFAPTDQTLAWAFKNGHIPDEVTAECEKFIDYHMAKGSRMVDWQRAFKNWLRNAKTFSLRPRPNGSVPGHPEYYDRHGNFTVAGSLARAKGEI